MLNSWHTLCETMKNPKAKEKLREKNVVYRQRKPTATMRDIESETVVVTKARHDENF